TSCCCAAWRATAWRTRRSARAAPARARRTASRSSLRPRRTASSCTRRTSARGAAGFLRRRPPRRACSGSPSCCSTKTCSTWVSLIDGPRLAVRAADRDRAGPLHDLLRLPRGVVPAHVPDPDALAAAAAAGRTAGRTAGQAGRPAGARVVRGAGPLRQDVPRREHGGGGAVRAAAARARAGHGGDLLARQLGAVRRVLRLLPAALRQLRLRADRRRAPHGA
ncbi:hypothetical protein KEM52_004634, partial [Ascosphaera acerosa]